MGKFQVLRDSRVADLAPLLQSELYVCFYRLVYASVYKIVKNHESTEDVIQDSFLRIIDIRLKEKGIMNVEGWLKKVAKNTALNHLRKQNKERVCFLDINEFSDNSRCSISYNAVEREVEDVFFRRFLEDSIESLKAEYRQVILLRYGHHLSYKSIARVTNLTEGTVRQRLARAKAMLKKRWLNEWNHSQSLKK